MQLELTIVLTDAEEGGYVATCPELGVVSEGETVWEAKANLREALQLFLECAEQREIKSRYRPEMVEHFFVA